MDVGIIGCGYVGLVVGNCLAKSGNHVIFLDNDKEKICKLKNGNLTIFEKDLEECFLNNINNNNIDFSWNLRDCIKNIDIIFIIVNTPEGLDGECDVSGIYDCVNNIIRIVSKDVTIIIKSTISIGTTRKVREHINKLLINRNVKIELLFNPEFLAQGTAINDFIKSKRVIIGTEDGRISDNVQRLYKFLYKNKENIIITSYETAELAKYSCNTFLATKISFINMIANICDIYNIDIKIIEKIMKLDERIGDKYLNSGMGYGGSCFPKDINALINIASNNNVDIGLLEKVKDINDEIIECAYNKIHKQYENIENKIITIWGLTFKSNTNDIRNSQSIKLIKKLLNNGYIVNAHNPVDIEEIDNVNIFSDIYESLKDSNGVVVCIDWEKYTNFDINTVKSRLKKFNIFDFRNILDKEKLIKNGFNYLGIGR